MTTLTARTPEDLLALAPVVLGFQPAESVVMLTFDGAHSFHARVDLPPPGVDAVDEMVQALLVPARRHRVGRVAFLIFTRGAHAAERVRPRLVRAFREQEIEVVDVIRADGRRWFPMLRHRRWAPAAGVPYDITTHPFLAQAVLDGRVTRSSREDVARSLQPDPERVARLEAALAGGEPDPPAWVQATVHRLASARSAPDDAEAARLLRAVAADVPTRDAAWAGLTRDGARDQVALWTDLLRRAPDDLSAAPAAVLALAAWLAGEGALAWWAVDRAHEVDPEHSLAALVADMLVGAVPPAAWEERFAMPDPA
jgi:hypothetical protein